jgi:hypothetical protein
VGRSFLRCAPNWTADPRSSPYLIVNRPDIRSGSRVPTEDLPDFFIALCQMLRYRKEGSRSRQWSRGPPAKRTRAMMIITNPWFFGDRVIIVVKYGYFGLYGCSEGSSYGITYQRCDSLWNESAGGRNKERNPGEKGEFWRFLFKVCQIAEGREWPMHSGWACSLIPLQFIH